MAQTLFIFQSPVPQAETMKKIESAVCAARGKVKRSSPGYMECALRRGKAPLTYPGMFEFYIGNDENPIVRVVHPYNSDLFTLGNLMLKPDPMDDVWNGFVEALLSQNPGEDFAITAGEPVVEAVMYSDNEVQQVFSSTTKNHPAYGKALLGGALFGATGAILGGMGGTSRTNTRAFSFAAKKVYMKIRMSNGRIREGQIDVRSKDYNRIMVNMKPTT